MRPFYYKKRSKKLEFSSLLLLLMAYCYSPWFRKIWKFFKYVLFQTTVPTVARHTRWVMLKTEYNRHCCLCCCFLIGMFFCEMEVVQPQRQFHAKTRFVKNFEKPRKWCFFVQIRPVIGEVTDGIARARRALSKSSSSTNTRRFYPAILSVVSCFQLASSLACSIKRFCLLSNNAIHRRTFYDQHPTPTLYLLVSCLCPLTDAH